MPVMHMRQELLRADLAQIHTDGTHTDDTYHIWEFVFPGGAIGRWRNYSSFIQRLDEHGEEIGPNKECMGPLLSSPLAFVNESTTPPWLRNIKRMWFAGTGNWPEPSRASGVIIQLRVLQYVYQQFSSDDLDPLGMPDVPELHWATVVERCGPRLHTVEPLVSRGQWVDHSGHVRGHTRTRVDEERECPEQLADVEARPLSSSNYSPSCGDFARIVRDDGLPADRYVISGEAGSLCSAMAGQVDWAAEAAASGAAIAGAASRVSNHQRVQAFDWAAAARANDTRACDIGQAAMDYATERAEADAARQAQVAHGRIIMDDLVLPTPAAREAQMRQIEDWCRLAVSDGRMVTGVMRAT